MTQKAYSQGSVFPPTTPGLLRIYSMRFCPYAERTRLVLEDKGITYETINIDLQSKPDWFLALNPLGQVPVLQMNDRVLPESTATVDWLDAAYPQRCLDHYKDPFYSAWDRVLLEYMSKLTSTLYRSLKAENEDLQTVVGEMDKHLAFYEEKLKGRLESGPFFGGQLPAKFDYMAWPFMERIEALGILKNNKSIGITAEKFPTLASWVKAMWNLPAVKAVAFDADSHLKFYKSALSGKPNYDLFLEE